VGRSAAHERARLPGGDEAGAHARDAGGRLADPLAGRAAGGDNLDPGRPVSYGFGWFLDPWRGRERQWHHGSTSGFRSVIERFPEDRVTVVILANREDIEVKALALEVAEPYLVGAR